MENNFQNFQQNPQNQGQGRSGNAEPLLAKYNSLLIPVSIVIAGAFVAAAIYFSAVYNANKTGNAVANNQQQQQQQQPSGPTKVSMDNDAVLGDKNAPVTMIEFSDYECPFCKRHFTDVYPEIKKDYIDTGKLKLVFRDFIAVPSHNPLATSEAMAAECAKDQGGDSAYFKYHDEIFKKTTSNGNGLALTQLPAIAKGLGLNVSVFQQCLDSNKFKDEVAKDNADALAALPPSQAGTPSFFIGKSSLNGTIDGTLVVGAQPYAAFKQVIDITLKP